MGRHKKEDTLVGKRVVAPRSLWPDYPLPRGQTGWEGKVGKRKDATNHFVHFPKDPSKYFFSDEEIKKWVQPDEGSGGETDSEREAPKRPAPSPRKKAATTPAPAASSGGRRPAGLAGGKRERDEPVAAAPSSSKKQKGQTRASKIALIDANLEDFNDGQVTAVYEFVLKVKTGQK